jgi:electron transport complex protein RnfE
MKIPSLSRGVIKDNAVLGIALGLCPVLAVTRTLSEGLAIGLAMVMVMFFGNLTVGFFGKYAQGGFKLPFFLLTAALYASLAETYFRFYHQALYQNLGIFLPLLAVNCLVTWRMDESATRSSVFRSARDGLGYGVGFMLAVFLVSLIRDFLGNGTLLGRPLFGSGFRDSPVLFFISPAGGFLVLGLLLALYKKLSAGGKA